MRQLQVEVVLDVTMLEGFKALLQILIYLVSHLWLFALPSSTVLVGRVYYLH